MACGAASIKTVLAIGTIPSDLIVKLADRDGVRVLHILESAGDAIMPESDHYKMITGSMDDRMFMMALTLQYDSPLILCETSCLTENIATVCREQWGGEYDERALLLVDGGMDGDKTFTVDVSTEAFPPVITLCESLDTIIESRLS